MKKWVLLTIILLMVIFNTGCVSRVANPSIEVTAHQQMTGSHIENLVDVKNTYVITFNILNNGTSIAKNVKIDYSYCDNVPDPNFQFCQRGSLGNIGDLQPYQNIIRSVTYDRSGYTDLSVIQKFQLRYDAESEI
jgi:hypothetical protein